MCSHYILKEEKKGKLNRVRQWGAIMGISGTSDSTTNWVPHHDDHGTWSIQKNNMASAWCDW